MSDTKTKDYEKVELWTVHPEPKLIGTGALEVGPHGLPVFIRYGDVKVWAPWSIPNVWSLHVPLSQQPGQLFRAWRAIEDVMTELAEWQRRHDSCGKEDVSEEEAEG